MPLPTNNSRPAIPYDPEQVLPNHNRYEALGKFPPTAQQLDGDFNGMVDLVNTLAGAINDTAAGIFPGADNPINADKLPTTDGQGNVSWTHVTPFNLADNAVQVRHLQDAAVTSSKIQVQAVGTNQLADGNVTTTKMPDNAVVTAKIADNAVTTVKMLDGSVTTAKMADLSITTGKLADSSVTTAKLADAGVTTVKIADSAVTTGKIADNAVTETKVVDRAITPAKVNSANAASGDVLTANGAGAASFLANKGRVLQIVSYENNTSLLNQYNASATPATPQSFQTGAFLIRITPQKTNSKIILFYSINVGSYRGNYASITLFKDNAPFKVGTAVPSYEPVTHSNFSVAGRPAYSSAEYGCHNFSSLFVDTGTQGTEIVYEIKKSSSYANLNNGYTGGYPGVSVMHAIEVDL